MAQDPKDDLARLAPYLEDFAEAALEMGEDTALLAAVCLRETWAGWAPGYAPRGTHLGRGDGGRAFGLFQIDFYSPYGKLPRDNPQAPPALQARWACQVLRDARRELAAFKDHPFFERACIAAYNAGSPAVRKALTFGQDPDSRTTGHDYGRDVLARRDALRARDPVRFPLPHPTKETP